MNFTPLLALIGMLACVCAKVDTTELPWSCIDLNAAVPLTTSGSVIWSTMNCTNTADPPVLRVNAILVDLTAADIKMTPGVSKDAANPLQTVSEMAAGNYEKKFIAGINGGYFWRTDISGIWVDDVCRGKTRKDADAPVELSEPNNGIHDGLVIIDGVLTGTNCDCWGYSRPALMYNMDATSEQGWSIDVLERGEQGQSGIQQGLAAGPNLVSYTVNADGTWSTFVDIPSDDDNININEHAANTGMGLIFDTTTGKATKMLLLTTDGSDECGRMDQSCGINAKHMAQLMLDRWQVQQAMSMDQGGSTTMWVKQAPGDGTVTNAIDGGSARNVANALFIELV